MSRAWPDRGPRQIPLASGAAACGLCAALAPRPAVAADSANGKRVYMQVGCFACHGRAGQGGAYNYRTPALAQTPMALDAFRGIVRSGPNEMPAYGESVLSDKDLADIHAFVRSLPGPRPPKEIPLLNR